jgi:type 1 glutamine amidotransferase
MADSSKDGQIPVAVVTGHHAYDVRGFQSLLRGLPGMDPYPQHLEDFAAESGEAQAGFAAIVFYNYHQSTPGELGGSSDDRIKQALERLGEGEQGIALLHHALVAFPRWEKWSEICGIRDRAFTTHRDQDFRVEIADPEHPITRGLSGWEMVDETYRMTGAGHDSRILLKTSHPESMATLAWTRTYRRAQVFCYQSGHDRRAYDDPNVRTVLARGIAWVSGRI